MSLVAQMIEPHYHNPGISRTKSFYHRNKGRHAFILQYTAMKFSFCLLFFLMYMLECLQEDSCIYVINSETSHVAIYLKVNTTWLRTSPVRDTMEKPLVLTLHWQVPIRTTVRKETDQHSRRAVLKEKWSSTKRQFRVPAAELKKNSGQERKLLSHVTSEKFQKHSHHCSKASPCQYLLNHCIATKNVMTALKHS